MFLISATLHVTPLAAGYITAAAARAGRSAKLPARLDGPSRGQCHCFRALILAAVCCYCCLRAGRFGMPWLNISGVVLGLTLAVSESARWPHLLTRVLQQARKKTAKKPGVDYRGAILCRRTGAAFSGHVATCGVNQGDACVERRVLVVPLFAIPAFLAVDCVASVKARQSQRATQKPLSRDCHRVIAGRRALRYSCAYFKG